MLLLSPRSGSARAGRGAPGKPPGRSAGQLQEKQLLQKQGEGTRQASGRLQRRLTAKSRVWHCRKDLLRVLEGARTLTVHGSNREGSVPISTRLPWTAKPPLRPQRSQGGFSDKKPDVSPSLNRSKKHGWKKNYQQNYTLFFRCGIYFDVL